MKVIFLNTWHGTMKHELSAYIQKHQQTTDVFCFQESPAENRSAYEALLANDFQMFNAERREDDGSWFSNTMYVRKGLPIINNGGLFTTNPNGAAVGIAAFVTLQLGAEELTICNIHGAPLPGHKLDTSARLYQSKTIIDTFKDHNAVIIGGDFNLLPQTQSVQTFAEHGYRNLIADYGIKSTRNHITYERYPDNIQYHADYTFVSPAIKVVDFTVPTEIVSDHQPLELTYQLQPVALLQPAAHDQFALA